MIEHIILGALDINDLNEQGLIFAYYTIKECKWFIGKRKTLKRIKKEYERRYKK